jgi:hypothetical protein
LSCTVIIVTALRLSDALLEGGQRVVARDVGDALFEANEMRGAEGVADIDKIRMEDIDITEERVRRKHQDAHSPTA